MATPPKRRVMDVTQTSTYALSQTETILSYLKDIKYELSLQRDVLHDHGLKIDSMFKLIDEVQGKQQRIMMDLREIRMDNQKSKDNVLGISNSVKCITYLLQEEKEDSYRKSDEHLTPSFENTSFQDSRESNVYERPSQPPAMTAYVIPIEDSRNIQGHPNVPGQGHLSVQGHSSAQGHSSSQGHPSAQGHSIVQGHSILQGHSIVQGHPNIHAHSSGHEGLASVQGQPSAYEEGMGTDYNGDIGHPLDDIPVDTSTRTIKTEINQGEELMVDFNGVFQGPSSSGSSYSSRPTRNARRELYKRLQRSKQSKTTTDLFGSLRIDATHSVNLFEPPVSGQTLDVSVTKMSRRVSACWCNAHPGVIPPLSSWYENLIDAEGKTYSLIDRMLEQLLNFYDIGGNEESKAATVVRYQLQKSLLNNRSNWRVKSQRITNSVQKRSYGQNVLKFQ